MDDPGTLDKGVHQGLHDMFKGLAQGQFEHFIPELEADIQPDIA
jgi:hypothetical protein